MKSYFVKVFASVCFIVCITQVHANQFVIERGAFKDEVSKIFRNVYAKNLINQATVRKAIVDYNRVNGLPWPRFDYTENGRLILDPKEHGLIRLENNGDLFVSMSAQDVRRLNGNHGDLHTLAIAHSRDVLIEGLSIRTTPHIAEGLKMSKNFNIFVRSVDIQSGYEDSVDIVRGKNIYFNHVHFKTGVHKGRGMTIKGGASHIYVANSYFSGNPNSDNEACINKVRKNIPVKGTKTVLPRTCHYIEVGNFDDYALVHELINPATSENYIRRPKTSHVYVDARYSSARISIDKRARINGGRNFPIQVWDELADVNTIYAFGDTVFNPRSLRRKFTWGWGPFKVNHTEDVGAHILRHWREATFEDQRARLHRVLPDKIAHDPTIIWAEERKFYRLKRNSWTNHRSFGKVYFKKGRWMYIPKNKLGWVYIRTPHNQSLHASTIYVHKRRSWMHMRYSSNSRLRLGVPNAWGYFYKQRRWEKLK